MYVAIQRINAFLLIEECQLPPRDQLVDIRDIQEKPKKRVFIPRKMFCNTYFNILEQKHILTN